MDFAISPESIERILVIGWEGLVAVLTLLIGDWASRWLSSVSVKLCTRSGIDEALARFLGQLVRYAVMVAVIIAALDKLGFDTTSIMTIFASAGLAVGLALQGSLSNFSAGVMILFFKPFRLGDLVDTAGESGQIHDIGLFSTVIHTLDNRKIYVPNSSILSGNITNFSALEIRRSTVEVGVAYGEDVGRVIEVLLGAARRSEVVLAEPAPAIFFSDMASSSLNFAVHIWSEPGRWLEAIHNVRRAIYEDLGEAGIEIPFTQVVIHRAGSEEESAAAAK